VTWGKGRDTVENLLRRGHLEQVRADSDEAQYLLAKARAHLDTAAAVAETDPEIAYGALYSAARKALTALLRQQGLRPTRAGGHEVVIEVAEAQLVPPLAAVLRPFRRLKRARTGGDYGASEAALSTEDVLVDLPAARAIVDAASTILPQLPVFQPAR